MPVGKSARSVNVFGAPEGGPGIPTMSTGRPPSALDEVAVSRAHLFLRCHARDLNRVIPAGQKVTLNLTGSYGHGARCRHRADLTTVELDAAVTQFAKRFPGLHFARFDLAAIERNCRVSAVS